MSYANHTSPRARQCQLPSIVKEPPLLSTSTDGSVSAPGGAQCRFGVDPAKPANNKKPGVERRANPSLL